MFIFSSIRPAWKPDINLKTSYPAFVRPDLNCCREPGGSSALPCINALVINIKMDLIPFGNSATRGVVFRSEFECLDDGLALSRQTTGLPLTRIPTAAVTWRVRGYIVVKDGQVSEMYAGGGAVQVKVLDLDTDEPHRRARLQKQYALLLKLFASGEITDIF